MSTNPYLSQLFALGEVPVSDSTQIQWPTAIPGTAGNLPPGQRPGETGTQILMPPAPSSSGMEDMLKFSLSSGLLTPDQADAYKFMSNAGFDMSGPRATSTPSVIPGSVGNLPPGQRPGEEGWIDTSRPETPYERSIRLSEGQQVAPYSDSEDNPYVGVFTTAVNSGFSQDDVYQALLAGVLYPGIRAEFIIPEMNRFLRERVVQTAAPPPVQQTAIPGTAGNLPAGQRPEEEGWISDVPAETVPPPVQQTTVPAETVPPEQPFGNTLAPGEAPPETEGDLFAFGMPENPLLPQISTVQQQWLDSMTSGAPLAQAQPFLSDLDIRQQQEAQELEDALTLRGIANSTIGDNARRDLASRQATERAELTVSMNNALMSGQGSALGQIYGQGLSSRQQSLDEFFKFLTTQYQMDAQDAAQATQSLALMLNALGISTIQPSIPNFTMPQEQVGAGSYIGNIAGNILGTESGVNWLKSLLG